jgi:histidyl-tRNA synthetase
LARVVAEYQSKLPKVFKRYQIQPVWRAERPGRGRFREFYQCDIDTIGSTSPVVEAEQIAAIVEILGRLGFRDFVIRINHRKFLAAWLSQIAIPADRHADALVTIDKVDKIGREGVAKELADKGFTAQQVVGVGGWIGTHYPPEWLESLEKDFDAPADAGLTNLREIVSLLGSVGAADQVRIDPSLARGLGYYTGAIMEINVADLLGSLAGGGRYDNLVGMFSGQEIPACGCSLGLERILVVMQERSMFPAHVDQSSVDIVVAAIDEAAQAAAVELANSLRNGGTLRVDLYPDVVRKMDRIFKYVDQRKAKFIAILGSDEIACGTVTVRNVATKTKATMKRADVTAFIARNVSE